MRKNKTVIFVGIKNQFFKTLQSILGFSLKFLGTWICYMLHYQDSLMITAGFSQAQFAYTHFETSIIIEAIEYSSDN